MSSMRFEQALLDTFSDLLGKLGRLGNICTKSGREPAVLYTERETRHCAAQDEPASRKGEQRQKETRECEALP